MMPRVVVDNTIEMTEEKISDVFLGTKEFHTSTEFSQFIEKSAFNAQTPCMDMVVDYCIKKEIEIESISKFLTANLKAKIKLKQGRLSKKSGYKKAIVTLKKGQSIDLTTGI